MSTTIKRSVDVQMPVSAVYNQWTQFEQFPRFMEGVTEVRQLTPTRLHWKATIGGQEKQWDAEIVEQTPDTRLSWRSTMGAENIGVIEFLPIDGGTRVTALMTYDPEGFIENLGDFLGFVTGRVEGDLKRFKEYIEARGQETGGWRGEVHQGQVSQRSH